MKKLMLLFAFFGLLGMQVYAQTTVTGKVTDQNGGGLPGVSVLVKGTNVGTMTTNDGSYSISVPDGSNILVFSYIGMQTQEVAVSGSTVDVVMVSDADAEIDEIVVTALGIPREKKSVGYAVSEVDGEDLNKTNNSNIINSISGKVAGLQIKANTNMGGSSNIVMRGSKSLVGNNQVLFVVDGVPVNNSTGNSSYQAVGGAGYDYGNAISDINPNDIANISVLKGAAATALYGSRAANGVIIITTKKGEKSEDRTFKVNINHSTMFHLMDETTFPTYQTNYGQGYGPFYSGIYNDGVASDYEGLYHYDFDGDGTDDYVTPTTEDASMGSAYDPNLMAFQWESFYPELPTYMQKTPYVVGANMPDYFFSTGKTFTTSVDITGGTKVSTFRLGYTNTDETGIVPNSSQKKNNFFFSGSFDITDKLTFSAMANYVNTNTVGRNNTGYSDNILSSFRQWFNLGVDMALQEEAYTSTGKNITWNPHNEYDLSPIYWDNPYWQRYENYQSDVRDRFIGYGQADWKIVEGLSAMARASVDYYYTLQEERKQVGSVSGAFGVDLGDVTSGYQRRNIFFMERNFDGMLKYNKNISEDLNINAFVGINSRRTQYSSMLASTIGGLVVPGLFSLGNSAGTLLAPLESVSKVGVDGIFGSVSLGYKNMLYLDGTLRRDVSSTLPIDNNTYYYPSGTLSFLFSEIIDAKWLNLGKVRLNYAKIGNDAPWGSTYDVYSIETPFDGDPLASVPTTKSNSKLEPELSTSIEAGLEMSFFNNRFGFDFAAYKTNTINQVVPVSVSYASGYSASYVNVGEVQNQGLEVSFNYNPIRKKDFRWDINLNWAKNVNEVLELAEGVENLTIARLQGGISINARVGEPYGSIQGTDFMYSPDGQKLIKTNGYYMKTATSDQIIGNIQPDWTGGINNAFTYKGISFSFLVDAQMGGSIFSLDQWYGTATGLYAETDYLNENGVSVRDWVLDANGDIIHNYFTNGYDATLGYASNSGGFILEGVVGTDENGDGLYDSNDSYVENIHRIPGNDYRAFGYSSYPNSAYIYDATYVKLREVSLGYTLPQAWTKKAYINSATISVVGSNLWIIYKDLPHADPEASQGAGNIQGWQSGVFPTTRNIGFTVNLQF